MSKLQLSMGCILYDRTQAIFDGKVKPEGINLILKEIVDHDSKWLLSIRYKIFDVVEMPLSNYLIGLDEGYKEWIALPIFLSRSFRHSTIFVNKNSGIVKPTDLEGRKIGIGNYFGSTTLWVRGLLQDHYGVDLSRIDWVMKNKVNPDKLPGNVKLTILDANANMEEMLETGAIDAYISERAPKACHPAGAVSRLFEDFKQEEIEYYQRFRVHPIRHVVVVRSEILEQHPWVAQSLYKCFDEARKFASLESNFDGHSKIMLPFIQYVLDETKKIFGDDYWPYGIEKNRETLSAFTRLSYEQGYTSRHFDVEEIFASHVLSVG